MAVLPPKVAVPPLTYVLGWSSVPKKIWKLDPPTDRELVDDLTKVCTDCGRCLTAFAVEPVKLCGDCGECSTAFARALTKVCAEVSGDVPTLIVNVPS